jgi:hypothetical protein
MKRREFLGLAGAARGGLIVAPDFFTEANGGFIVSLAAKHALRKYQKEQ